MSVKYDKQIKIAKLKAKKEFNSFAKTRIVRRDALSIDIFFEIFKLKNRKIKGTSTLLILSHKNLKLKEYEFLCIRS